MSSKKILTNTIAQLLGRGISTSFTFITTYLIIRLGDTTLYGDMTKALAILAICYTALDFGINAHVVRAYSTLSQKARHSLFSNLLLLRVLMSVVIILISNLIVNLLPGSLSGGYTLEVKQAFRLASFAILFQGVYTSTNSVFQHQLNYSKSVLASSLGAVTLFLASATVLLSGPTLNKLLLANVLGFFVTALVSLFFVRTWLASTINLGSALIVLKKSLLIGAVLLLSIIATKADVVILGIFRASSEVGEYGLAYKILDLALVLPVFIMNAVYPFMLKKASNQQKVKQVLQKTLKILLPLSILGGSLLYFLSPLITLIKPGLYLSISSLKILAFSLPLFYLSAPLMWLLITLKLEKQLVKIYLFAAAINIIGNYTYIPHLGSTAAAALTIVTESFILTGLFFVAKRKKYV